MAKTITFSFSVPVDLAILIEERLETDKITRSELIKRALWYFLDKKNYDIKNMDILDELHKNVLEIRKLLEKK